MSYFKRRRYVGQRRTRYASKPSFKSFGVYKGYRTQTGRRARSIVVGNYRMGGYTGRHGGEIKYVDGFYNSTSIHSLSDSVDDTWADCEANPRQTTAIYGCMPVPRQGTNYADRDGRHIFVKNIRINGLIDWQAIDSNAAAVGIGEVRIVIVKDTRTNGVALSAENVIGPGLGSDGNATTSGDGAAICLPTNPDGWGRYKILYDKTFRAPPQPAWGDNTNAGNTNSMTTKFKIKIKANCTMNFNASTGAIGSIIDNSFHMLAAAQDNTAAPALRYYARTTFVG